MSGKKDIPINRRGHGVAGGQARPEIGAAGVGPTGRGHRRRCGGSELLRPGGRRSPLDLDHLARVGRVVSGSRPALRSRPPGSLLVSPLEQHIPAPPRHPVDIMVVIRGLRGRRSGVCGGIGRLVLGLGGVEGEGDVGKVVVLGCGRSRPRTPRRFPFEGGVV